MRLFRLPNLPWDLPEELDRIAVVAPAGSDPFAAWVAPLAVASVVPQAAQEDDGGVVLVDLVGEVEAHAKASGTVAVTPVATPSLTALRTSYTSGAAGAYNVTINFTGSWTSALQDVFVAAANRISAVIVGDLPNVKVGTVLVDDIVISASLRAIDGAGGILGQAGPTALRAGTKLPATAMMQFDSADAASYQRQGLFDEIVTHEMLHAVGVGSIWAAKSMLSGNGFIGKNAVAEYNKLVDGYTASHGGSTRLASGTQLSKGAVPIETQGGAGTARVHWSETVFDSEMMTGWLDTAPRAGMVADPLSAITTASLKDLGYVVAARPATDFYILG